MKGASSCCLLLELPTDALLALLSHLGPQELLRFGATCRAFRDASRSECLWMGMCSRAWEKSIPLSDWRARVESAQALFRLLSAFDPIVGPWTVKGHEPRGRLIYVTWGDASLKACEVLAGETDELRLKLMFEAIGVQNGSFTVDILNEAPNGIGSTVARFPANLVWTSKAEPGFSLHYNASRGAFMERAISFRFTREAWKGFVQPTSSAKGEDNIRCDFSKLKLADPASGKELAGLWKGVYGPHGVEIINITEKAGNILGTKILGDPNVPCGQVSFKASLSSESSDVSEDLQRIIDFQLEDYALEFRVAKMYMGHGRIADRNFQNPLWVPGLLLVSQRSRVAFLWGELNSVVPFERLDLAELYKSEFLSSRVF